MRTFIKIFVGLTATALLVPSISAQNSPAATQHNAVGNVVELENQAQQTIATFKQQDPTLSKFFRDSAGYAVFPTVTEGALGVGAAHGTGLVYQNVVVACNRVR